jgi:hypothetical protein
MFSNLELVGQGILGTNNNGLEDSLNGRYFNFLPRELPEIVKNILNSAQQHAESISKN